MSKTFLICFAIVAMSAFSSANADDAVKAKILELYPQADTNGDGIISDAEEAVVSRQGLKRYPQADKDGDGVLSDAEKQALLRMAANRVKSKTASNINEQSKEGAELCQCDVWRTRAAGLRHLVGRRGRADSIAIYIHGGGFKSGSKEKLKPDEMNQLLNAGISVAAINYRYVSIAPLPQPHHDARRALQFIRSKADQWNIDKDRVAAFGGSAGAQICMWLAFTDEMANPNSTEPIERESTRLTCVATAGGQTANSAEFGARRSAHSWARTKSLNHSPCPSMESGIQRRSELRCGAQRHLEEANEIASRHAAQHRLCRRSPIFMSYGMSPTDKLPSDPSESAAGSFIT